MAMLTMGVHVVSIVKLFVSFIENKSALSENIHSPYIANYCKHLPPYKLHFHDSFSEGIPKQIRQQRQLRISYTMAVRNPFLVNNKSVTS